MGERDLPEGDQSSPIPSEKAKQINDWAYPLGFWSAVIATLGGILYFLVIVGAMLGGRFVYPPAEPIQLFGGVITLLFCPLLVILLACVHSIAPNEKRVFSQVSLGFALLFALAVSINRFTQLGVVRESIASGNVQGVDWFLAYGNHSILFGLEMLGWAWFLGLAMLFAAPVFSRGRLQRWLRALMIVYGVVGLSSASAFLLASPLAVVGFIGWGLILYIITGLLALFFRRAQRALSSPIA